MFFASMAFADGSRTVAMGTGDQRISLSETRISSAPEATSQSPKPYQAPTETLLDIGDD